jgi:SAM-dependent methyltransferase
VYEAEKRARRYERLYGQRVLRPMIPHLLRAAPSFESGGVFLDWESGPGTLSCELLPLLPHTATLLATDQDRAALRVYHAHPELDGDERCFVRQEPPDELSLTDGVVDVAFGHWRWQHLSELRRSVIELCRVVRPAGNVVLSFLVPGSGGSLNEAFARIGANDIARTMENDGLATSAVRELLREGNVAQIEVRTATQKVTVGGQSRPMMDPLLLDFLLPRWMSRATGEEVTSVNNAPFDLGPDPLVWEFRVGIATAVMPEGTRQTDAGDTTRTPLPKRSPL